MRKRLFISSVQGEFAQERRLLCEYVRNDALLCKFFEPFIFEELPAINLSAPQAYLTEAAASDIYLGIYGHDYGYEDAEGISPTEREYDTAKEHGRYRMVFIKRCEERHPKESTFIKKVEQDVVRKSFSNFDELRTAVYASLVRYMEEQSIVNFLPWDATFNRFATMDDIDPAKVSDFVDLAQKKRKLNINYKEENIPQILQKLDLASADGRLTNSALLLFAKRPQHFFPSCGIKCMMFPSPVKCKPILSLQVYEGGLLEMIDDAIAYVMQHVDAYVGTHTTASVDVQYEVPIEAVTEAIVNAATHRDYQSNGSIQVEIYPDRIEIWNPGMLPMGLTIEQLKGVHKSIPNNPILAKPVYLAGYIERVGSGTTDMIEKCEAEGLKAPEFKQDGDFQTVIWRKKANVTPNVLQNVTPINADNKEVVNFEGQNDGQNVPQNVPQSKQLKRLRLVLETILANRNISTEGIGEILGVSYKTVRRDINILRNSFRIEWVGSPKTGHWEVETLNK